MSAPVGNTCPDINSLIASIKEAYDCLITATDTLNVEENKEQIKCIESAMEILKPLFSKYHNPLEDLRDANYELRQYGEKWEEKCDDIERELDIANEQISNLETEIKELQQTINQE